MDYPLVLGVAEVPEPEIRDSAGAWSPPQEFDGYRLQRLIGRGGMGQVHLARDTVLDRLVAIKFISAAEPDESARQRFLVEARAIARLQHPNVVSIYRVGEVDGYPYLVSEFIRGKGLDRIAKPVPWRQALKIGIEIARALAAAHRSGVVHRDIKPANAILSDEGEVKLLDFGIAKLLNFQVGSGPRAAESDPPVRARWSQTPMGASYRPGPRLSNHPSVEPTQGVPFLPEYASSVPKAPLYPSDLPTSSVSVPPAEPTQRSAYAMTPNVAAAKLAVPRLALPKNLGLTTPGIVVGTPLYMAPELWRGEPATFRSDVYSLGALLYALCVGDAPHGRVRREELRATVLEKDSPPLAQVVSGLDPAFAAIVDRCLSRDPALRFGSGDEVRVALAQLTPEARAQTLPEGNPYRGLHAFEAEHRGLYFGRDSEIRMILERLNSDAFVLVAGDSGVGKSSLCRAGVLPRISEWLEQRRGWSVVKMVPGKHPILSLSEVLAPVLGQPSEQVQQALLENAGTVCRSLQAKLDQSSGLVLFIDQFEELVTISDRKEAQAMAELVGWLMTMPASALRLLATVRGDFLSRLAALPSIGDGISRALYFLRPLSRDRIREAIVGPAKAKGVVFESDALVDSLVESTVRAEGGLPLLQFALAELWEARGQRQQVISTAALEALGGVAGALTRHADQVVAQMPPAIRDAARRLLLRLVTSDGTRARRTDTELVGGDSKAQAALDSLVRGRLIVARDTPEGPGYEIAHEALLHSWGTLARWLAADADGRVVRERLALAVADWERLGCPKEVLWTAPQLAEVTPVDPAHFSEKEKAFLLASQQAARRARRLRWTAAVVAPLAIVATYLGVGLQARRDVRGRVDAQLAGAQQSLEQARAKWAERSALQKQAYAQFDLPDPKAAEQTWANALGRSAELMPLYGRAAQQLETALLLDHQRRDAQELFADLLYERALVAEQSLDSSGKEELLQRLGLYDQGGKRRQKWDAAALLSVELSPEGASLSLERYEPAERGKLQLVPVVFSGPVRDLSLAPGSYLLTMVAPGRVQVRYPLVLGRDERRQVRIMLPRSEQVPEGYVYVPPGQFQFGSAAEDSLRRGYYHTAPLHEVRTQGYLIARYETTFADWIEYLEALPAEERKNHAPRLDKGGFQGAIGLKELPGGGWQLTFEPTTQSYSAKWSEKVLYPGRTERAFQDWRRFPVFGIAIDDAQAYVGWLSRTGRVKGARLCTDYEWERAARGADFREYPHGSELSPEEANIDDTYKKSPQGMGPDEVGSHPASRSPFGLDDMTGNVWEWVRSSLAADEYAARGGSYYFDVNAARSTEREVPEPTFRDATVGMRVCADSPIPGE